MTCLIQVDVEAKGVSTYSGKCSQIGACLQEDPHTPGNSIRIILRNRNGTKLQKLIDDNIEEASYINHQMAEFNDWILRMMKGRGIARMVSDNPAFDWQWVAYQFDVAQIANPFGYSARRIGDFYAGLVGDFMLTQPWKTLRVTKHDHNPEHDAIGNAEALARLIAGERPPTQVSKEDKKRYY